MEWFDWVLVTGDSGITLQVWHLALVVPLVGAAFLALQLLRFALRYPWRFVTLLAVGCHLATLCMVGVPFDRADADWPLWTVLLMGIALNFVLVFRLMGHLLRFTLRARK